MPSAFARRVLVSATLLLLPAVILAGAWRLGGASALEDDLIYYLPVRQYIAERIRAGEFPLWNPLVALGTPVAADPQSGLFYPPTYLFLLLPPLIAYPASLVLHFALAGAGMYRLLRASRHDWRAALLAAVAFEFCGYLVAHRAHLTIHHAAAWLPWMLYGWRRYANSGRLRHAALASGAFGFQMLVQHVQISIISIALVAGYVVVVLLPWRRAQAPAGSGWRRWWAFPAGMLAGGMMAGVQLLPTWMHFSGSVRGSPAYYLFTENPWYPTSALMLLFPMLFGARTPNLWSEPWWGISHFCEQSAYATILILVLAVASLSLIAIPLDAAREGQFGRRLLAGCRFLQAYSAQVWSALRDGRAYDPRVDVRVHRTPGFMARAWASLVQDARVNWRFEPCAWNREIAFWWGAILIALLIALGDMTPLSKLLFHVPVYRSLRVPARWILVWSVAMPVLASAVMTVLLRGGAARDRVARALELTVRRALPVGALVCLLVLAIALGHVQRLAHAFPTERARPVLAGLTLASRLDNPAIWWPVLVMIGTGWSLTRWLRTRRPLDGAVAVGIFVLDLVSVAAFVDVDTRIYRRADLTRPPPLAEAIHSLSPKRGERLLVPRYDASYERPLEVLWPQSNLRAGVATLNGYGPLWPVGSRLLFRFMPWGSSEEMLAILRNGPLLRAMGVRFVAVRSAEERSLLQAARVPADPSSLEESLPGAAAIKPVRYGHDLVWGPVPIPQPGQYELAMDVVPVPGSPSRWFVRLETPEKDEIGKTRSVDPADMSVGPRRMRFVYQFDRPVPELVIRVKAEMGEVMSAGNGTLRRIAPPRRTQNPSLAADPAGQGAAAFTPRAELPGKVSLYEVSGARPLVYWSDQVVTVSSLSAAVDRLHAGEASGADVTVVESPGPLAWSAPPQAPPTFDRPTGHELRVHADSATGGLLVFNESLDPGWQAQIDGQPAALLRVNAVCMGLVVPAGTHEVSFTYRPRGLWAAAGLTATGALLLAAAAVRRSRPG